MIAMLKPIAPFVEYALNQEYIAEFLCINKDKPEMACGGKCHLMEQLKKQEKEEPKQLRIAFEEYPIGFVQLYLRNSIANSEYRSKQRFGHHQNYSFLFSEEIFHPPACC